MSFQIDCPNCCLRPVGEFRYGGPVRERPKASDDEARWTDYLYNKPNVRGLQTEWWYHRSGCKTWFIVERATRVNQILTTRQLQPEEQSGA